LTRKGVDILNALGSGSFNTFIGEKRWVVCLLIEDIHNLTVINEVSNFFFAAAIWLSLALLQVIGDDIALNSRSVSVEVDFSRLVQAEKVWPEAFFDSCLIRLEFE